MSRQQQQEQGQQDWQPGRQQLLLQLYDDDHSEYCAKVKVALHHKQLTWQALPAGPCDSDNGKVASTLALQSASLLNGRTPLGKIPALVVQGLPGQHTQVVLFESEVINEWLEEQFPLHPPLLPQDPFARSQARLISRMHDLYLEPALRKLYPQVSPVVRDVDVVASAAAEFNLRLSQLEQVLPGNTRFAAADHLTLADCGLPALLLYAEKMWPVLGFGALDYTGFEKLSRLRNVLWEDPCVAKVLKELEPAAQEWIDRKVMASKT